MSSFYCQGWIKIVSIGIFMLLSLAACDEQGTNTYEDDLYEEVVEDGFQEDEDFFNVETEEYIYEEEDFEYIAEEEEDVFVPPPEVASIPPVGDVISDPEWEEITDGISFERTEPEEPKEPKERNPGMDFGKGFEMGISTLAWVLIIALILGFLAWLMMRTKVDTSVDKVRDFTLTDELLAASKKELADALSQNLSRGDYRAAIRYRFGQLLQGMRKEGLLVWVPGRTNSEYQLALQAPFAVPFGVLAKAFSYAMYSGREVTLEHYESFARDADSFKTLFPSLTLKPSKR